MKIINKKISTLIMADYNPRMLKKNQYEQLKTSIQTFGLVDPIIVNVNKERKNIIVGGHQRVRVAKDLGYKEVPCVEVDLDINRERELNVRLNKNTGQFDFDMLANVFDTEELIQWGFENWELAIGDEPDVEENDLKEELDTYLENEIKQIVLYYDSEEYPEMLAKLDIVAKEIETDDNSSVIKHCIDFYLQQSVKHESNGVGL